MFGRFVANREARELYARNQGSFRAKRIAALEAKLVNVRSKRTEEEKKIEAQIEAERTGAMNDLPTTLQPSPRIIAVAAYIHDCASATLIPDYHDASARGYMVTGAALSTGLNDAIAFKWIGKTPQGELYWRDEGLTESCPLVILAKMHPKMHFRPEPGAPKSAE